TPTLPKYRHYGDPAAQKTGREIEISLQDVEVIESAPQEKATRERPRPPRPPMRAPEPVPAPAPAPAPAPVAVSAPAPVFVSAPVPAPAPAPVDVNAFPRRSVEIARWYRAARWTPDAIRQTLMPIVARRGELAQRYGKAGYLAVGFVAAMGLGALLM